MHEPFGALLVGLAMPWASIIYPAGIDNPDLLIEGPQGSGPYALVESVRSDRYVAQARPEYTCGARGSTTADKGFPQTLVYQVVDNKTTAANLFLAGERNIVTISGADFDRVAAAATFAANGYSFGAVWLHVNIDEGLIGADPAIRQIVYKAVSREEYLDVGFGGRGLFTNTFVSPQAVCFDAGLDAEYDEAVGVDPEAARQILADAGYAAGVDGMLADADGNPVVLRLVDYGYAGSEGSELLILSLEVVGFTVGPIIVEFGGYLERLVLTGEWDVAILPVNPPVPPPSALVGYFSGGGAINTASTANATLDAEFALANVTAGEESCMHWSNAMRALLEDFDFKPLFSPERTDFGQGVEFTLFNDYTGTWDPITTRIVGEKAYRQMTSSQMTLRNESHSGTLARLTSRLGPCPRFLLKRLASLFVVLAILLVLTFLLTYLAPGDPAVHKAGIDASAENIELERKALGLDQPAHIQFVRCIECVARLDFSTSFITKQSVTEILQQRFPRTFRLAGAGLLIVMTVRVPLGILVGDLIREGRNRRLEVIVTSLTGTTSAMPEFLTATFLAFIFAVT